MCDRCRRQGLVKLAIDLTVSNEVAAMERAPVRSSLIARCRIQAAVARALSDAEQAGIIARYRIPAVEYDRHTRDVTVHATWDLDE